jgi:hypothetical protein
LSTVPSAGSKSLALAAASLLLVLVLLLLSWRGRERTPDISRVWPSPLVSSLTLSVVLSQHVSTANVQDLCESPQLPKRREWSTTTRKRIHQRLVVKTRLGTNQPQPPTLPSATSVTTSETNTNKRYSKRRHCSVSAGIAGEKHLRAARRRVAQGAAVSKRSGSRVDEVVAVDVLKRE